MSAGHLFRCVCCGEEGDESVAAMDKDLDGPVCPECQHNLVIAEVGLRRITAIAKGENKPARIFSTCTHKFHNRIPNE